MLKKLSKFRLSYLSISTLSISNFQLWYLLAPWYLLLVYNLNTKTKIGSFVVKCCVIFFTYLSLYNSLCPSLSLLSFYAYLCPALSLYDPIFFSFSLTLSLSLSLSLLCISTFFLRPQTNLETVFGFRFFFNNYGLGNSI